MFLLGAFLGNIGHLWYILETGRLFMETVVSNCRKLFCVAQSSLLRLGDASPLRLLSNQWVTWGQHLGAGQQSLEATSLIPRNQ